MKIACIQTGGTIDKDYPKTTQGYAFEITDPAVKRILNRVNPAFQYEIKSVLKKDSLDMTSKDREKIYKFCKTLKNDKILITHGTDTMIKTATKLSSIQDKVIVLTGALRPERFSNSDADCNVGTAIGALNVLEGGVYIAMHGRVYCWDEVKRNKETGQFVKK